MTTSSDVGSISAWVLDLNNNQPLEQKTSGAQDNPSYDNGMEICASTSLPPQTSESNEYFGDKSATISSGHTTYSLAKKSELIEVGVGSCFDTNRRRSPCTNYDAGVYFEYTLDEENRLRNLFWTDTVARYDCEQFGDVLAFDATYKKNAYNKPLVTFVGMVIKLCKAIKTVMSGCVHRLCCWHLERNAQANVKRNEFTSKFRQLMLNPMSMEKFDRDWFSVVYDLGLEQNPWVEKMYAKHRKWTEAYLKGTFFAGMRTTQRCQSLNSYLRRFVEQKLKLYDFIRQIHRAMYCIRYKEVQDEYETNHTAPVLTTHLQSIEKHASEIYTRNVLKWVRMEILGEATLIMLRCAKTANSNIYILTKFQHPEQKWTVVLYNKEVAISCSCKMMESTGIPCRHIFHVMKFEQLVRIPPTLILGH
ncbi:hypothetical protein CUMW_266540 [Citrus unshiu]|uniref:Protein FAR1-RELATED SEQUENCE n=1 Tax=Citrus unshiu TaxID=55188 RepID=A0A2H5QVT7_CITUN|nr:hypothetical protein CUMW_266540 [Citrus unshiu]